MFCQIVTIICGLITPRFMLVAYGSEANGAITSITTFLGYIALLEGGIGGVARAALYRPLAENNIDHVSAVMTETKAFFKRVGYFFSIYVLIIASTFKFISHTDAFDWFTSFLLVLIISASTFAQYFIGISNVVLLYADQRQYIVSLIATAGTVINAILVVILTTNGCPLLILKAVTGLVFILRPIMLWIIVKKYYPLKRIKSKISVLKDKWTGIGQHIAWFLHSHTDVVILTVFGNLRMVSVYGVYYMVTHSLENIAFASSSGMEAVFGNMYAKKEIKQLNQTFGLYDMLMSMVSVILFGVTITLIVPFVKMYTLNVSDTNYIEPLFGIVLCCAHLFYCLREPYHSMIIAAGHFKQTNAASYGEAVINIFLSVILVHRFGLVGVAFGTVAATLYRFVFYAVYLSKTVLNRNIRLFLRREAINVLALFLVYGAGKLIIPLFNTDSYLRWMVAAAIIALTGAVITALVNFIFYRKEFIHLCKFLRKNN